MSFSNEELAAVLAALGNPEYKWRTMTGVADETGLSLENVLEIVSQNRDSIIKSSNPSVDGEDLYTTRTCYRENTSPMQKLWQ